MTAIPKRIHYCWYGGAPLSPLGRRCVETWSEMMPDYELVLWDERALDRSIPYLNIAYRQKRWAFVADYVRIRALYDEGGVYFDTDIEALRRLDPLLDSPLFMGLQAPQSVGVGVIGATPGHPFLKRILDRLDAEASNGRPSFLPLPDLVTELMRADVTAGPELLPEECFYPYNPYSPDPLRQKPLQSNLTEHTYCVHHWEGTWLGAVTLRSLLSSRVHEVWRKLRAAPRPPLTTPAAQS